MSVHLSKTGSRWNSEVMVTNSRFFGHALSAIRLEGGDHALISNNVIGDSSIRTAALHSAIEVAPAVSNFVVQGNHIGSVFRGQGSSGTKFGVAIEAGSSDNFVVAGNTLVGNRVGGISDNSTGTNKVVANNVS